MKERKQRRRMTEEKEDETMYDIGINHIFLALSKINREF